MFRHEAGQDIALREQIGAAMMIDDALGVAGRARSIIERDRIPFIVGQRPCEIGIARGDEALIVDLRQALALDLEFRDPHNR